MTAEQFKRGYWMLPISPVVDAGYENDNNLKNMRAGLESPQSLCAETNRNWENVLDEKGEAAFKVAIKADALNKRLKAAGVESNITAFDLMQLSENPVQFQQAEDLAQGKGAAPEAPEKAAATA